MGLPERHKIKKRPDIMLPERSREIAEIFGQAVPFEVDWASVENWRHARRPVQS